MPATPVPYRGPLVTNSFIKNEDPQSWRDGIMDIFVNGAVPTVAMTSRMKSEKLENYTFNWWIRGIIEQAGNISGIYKNVLLSSAYGDADLPSAGDTAYLKCAAAAATEMSENTVLIVRKPTDTSKDFRAVVTGRNVNGNSSYLEVKCITAPTLITGVTRAIRIGTAFPQRAEMPEAVMYQPEQVYNYPQISWRALDLSRSALRTKLRTRNAYLDEKKTALYLISTDIEWSALMGYRHTDTGSNGKPRYYTYGLIPFMQSYTPNNCCNFVGDAEFTGTWEETGWDFLEAKFELMNRYKAGNKAPASTKLVYCGGGVISAINKLARANSTYNISDATHEFGLNVKRWISPWGTFDFYIHPLFNYETSFRNCALFWEPQNTRYRYIDDITFLPDNWKKGGQGKIDGLVEGYIADVGFEWHYPELNLWLEGLGLDNS